MHSGPTGGHRQNPTFWILIEKSKISLILSKKPKGFDFKVKNKKVLLLEKIATFHWNLKFSLNSVGKKHKISKKSRLGETQGLLLTEKVNTINVFWNPLDGLACVSPKRDFFPTEFGQTLRF